MKRRPVITAARVVELVDIAKAGIDGMLSIGNGRRDFTARYPEGTAAVKAIDDLAEAVAAIDRDKLALQAMVEQAGKPRHIRKRCGTNDCPACEWMGIADDLNWPPWRRLVRGNR